MQIEIWSDFACPFCYIGKRRFEKALEQFPHRDQVDVVYRSFELDPDTPKELPYDVHDMLSKKYGMSRSQAIANNANVGHQAAEEGLDFQFDRIALTNTFDAHRLSHFAGKHGKRAEVTELLFKGYFTDGSNLSDRDYLLEVAAAAGLDRQEAAAVLAGSQYADEVRNDEETAGRLGVRGVPFYVMNRKYGVSGAQPLSVFVSALQQAWDDSQTIQVVESADGSACTDDSCAIDGK
ncbi:MULTISPECIES: DsbA family oxidoreductase [Cohnella]|uniref:DsbA family oxidoreductase n=1 Tax=Cohnella TaxID=329857 RepID=UPI0009BAC015|nr:MULTISPECIES: DsbA family oxidoreductase [Cohnella]MBN2983740.1 DsbA family oxidoreductase [Cohnella algarum]